MKVSSRARTVLCLTLIAIVGPDIGLVREWPAVQARQKASASRPTGEHPTSNRTFEDDKLARTRASETYPNLPLRFEANRGQSDSRVKFQARGSGYSLFLTDSEAVLSLAKPVRKEATKPGPNRVKDEAGRGAVLRMRPVGANPKPHIKGVKELPGRTNYFIGNDPARWRTAVPTYERVEYRSVYPGIDLTYYGNQRQLEYDSIIAPGARPSAIELDFEGADRVEITDGGDLLIALGDAEVVQSAPVVYQEMGTERRTVTGRYALRGKGRVGFEVGAYDRSRTLVIDPTIDYATYLGGNGFDWAWGIAVDTQGNVFVTGEAGAHPRKEEGFPTAGGGAGAHDTSQNGMADVFVSKPVPDGSLPAAQQLSYSNYLGGADNERGVDIALDSTQTWAYVVGDTSSGNFPTQGNSVYDSGYNGRQDAFVAKLDAYGGLTWSTFLGGGESDTGAGIAVDGQGIAFVTGHTAINANAMTNYQQTTGAYDETHNGGMDGFVTKMDANGNRTWSTFIGGSGDDYASDIALEGGTTPYITGWTYDAVNDYPTTPGAYDETHNGSADAFVTKLDATGSAPLGYSTFIGSTDREESNAMSLSAGVVVSITGFTLSNNFPTTANTFDSSINGGTYGDVFVTQLNTTNPANMALAFSTFLGGNGSETSQDIVVDGAGAIYVVGGTESTDFPTTNSIQNTNGGGFDMFLTKLNPVPNKNGFLILSTYIGGPGHDVATGMGLDGVARVYICGFSWDGMGTNNLGDSNITTGAFDTTFNTQGGPSDAVVIKLTP